MNEQQIQELKNLVDKLQAEGLPQDQIQAQVDAKKQEFLGKTSPVGQGAPAEINIAPDTEFSSESGSSDSQNKSGVITSALQPLSMRKRLIGANDFVQFFAKIPELAVAGVDVLNKLDLDAKLESGEITSDEYNDRLFGDKSPSAVFGLDKLREFTDAGQKFADELKSQGQEDPNRSIFDEFFSEEGNIRDGVDKISNGVIGAIPSVMAAFAGTAGMSALFTSAAGGAYQRKTEVEPTKTGDFFTFATSIAQGGVELASEMVTRGIVKGFGSTVLAQVSPQAVKNVYKATTKNIAGRITSGGFLEGSSEVGAQEINRYLDFVWDENNAFGYQNPDGTYNTGEILKRSFDTFLISSIIGGTLGTASPNSQLKNYANERLSTTKAKAETLKAVNKIAKLEEQYAKNPSPLIANEILQLQKQVIDNKILNDKVLSSFTDAELTDYAAGKIAISEAKESLNSIEDAEIQDQLQKTIEKEEKALDQQYNNQKAIILMLNFGPNATNAEIKEGVQKSKTNKLADEINNTYEDATSKADWDSSVANEAITKLYGDGQNGALARIIKNKITGEMTRLPDFSREDFISEVTTELIPHIRNFNPEQAAGDSKITLSGWINGFIDRKIAGVLGSKKASKEQFESEVTSVQETQFDIDDSTQDALDFVRTEPQAKEQLRDVAGITKESVQSDATQILKGRLPGILEKSGRDKNEILTAINNASKLKIADAVLEEMGGNFNNKQEQNSRFITFLDTNFDAIIKSIPNSVKNKLPLFEAKQIRRENSTTEGDAAGKGVFEYKNPTRNEFIQYYTEGGLTTLRAKKKKLADILAQEIGKDAIAEVLQDPAMQQEFLDRQRFQKKDIPQDAIPKFLQRIDRTIASLESSLKDQKGQLQMDVTGGMFTAAKQTVQYFSLKILKGIRRLLANNVGIEDAASQILSEISAEMNLSPEQAQVFVEGIGTLTLEDLNNLDAKVELALRKTVVQRFADQSNTEIKNLQALLTSNVDQKIKEDALVEFFKYIAPAYQRTTSAHKLWKNDSAAATYNFWSGKFDLKKYNIILKGKEIQHIDPNTGKGKKISTLVSATRPRTTKATLRNAIKKQGSIEKAIPVIETALDATDAQGLQNREFILRHAKDLLLSDGKQAVIDFLSILGAESESALRLVGKLRGYENVKGTEFVYEHTPPIQDLQQQMYDVIKNNDSDSDIIAGMREILESSRVDLISDPASKKLDDLGRKTSGRDLSRYKGAIQGDIVLFKRNNQKAIENNSKINLDAEFNAYLEASTGISANKRFSKAKAEARGRRVRKSFGDYFVPPGAEDFAGLLHKTLAKGKKGEQQLEFYKKHLYDPYNVANENITREKAALMNDFNALKGKLNNVPKKLKELTSDGDYTKDAAVRVFIWSQQGMKIPGLSKTDARDLINEVKNDKELLSFANELISISKGDGYAKPDNNWLGGNVATDLMSLLNTSKRSKHLEVWQNNVDTMFSEANLNKLEAAYGKAWVTNFKKTLDRMKTGMNRKWGGDPMIQSYLDWVNGSVGAIMFLNTRSAVLQTISNVNYLNFGDNNPLKAAQAFANQKQYWSDFVEIFNSDYLVERRGGNKINVNESEIALAAEKGGIQGTISLLLNKGFIFTKIADSFAIATGGATMYRNRIKTYIKDGLSEAEAKEKAFIDFKAITEETQQSSRPDRISEQQASNAGRLLLAFANTPMQYNRIIKKNAQDLVDGRGDPKEKVSKIIYYSTIQNLLFNAAQKALFALAFADGDDDEEEISKYASTAEGMADSLLRGSGLTGNAVVAVKNVAVDIARRSGRPRPNFKDAAWKAATLSPPINNKLTKVRGALYSLDYVTPKNVFDPSLDNPALSAGANMISATTNVPLDRALRKMQNIEAAMSDEAEWWQRTALLMGWGTWELGMEDKPKRKQRGERIIGDRVIEEKISQERIIN
jgi:hypothetical protein